MKLLATLPEPKYKGPVLQLSKYTSSLAPPPSKVYWEYKIPENAWQMFGNDTLGDCEIARIAHMLMLFTAHTGEIVVPTLQEVTDFYYAITGGQDTGAASPDVFDRWQKVGIAGHKIAGWAQVDSTQLAVEQAIWLFGAAASDVAVYSSMMDQFNAGQPWDNPSGDLVGYHAVPYFGFGSQGTTCVTWAKLQPTGWTTLLQIMQGNYAVITQDWIDQGSEKAPNGFDFATLTADLQSMSGN